MKREEAEQVWGMITAIYSLHPERSAETSVAWVPALEEMDAEIVMQIISHWMKGVGPVKLPSLVAFASEVRLADERRKEDAKPAATLEVGLPLPPWYIAYQRLRDAGDMRLLPEQEGGYRQMGHEWPPIVLAPVPTDDGSTEWQAKPLEIISGEEYEQLLAWAGSVKQDVPNAWVEAEPDCVICLDQALVEVGHTTYRLGNRLCRNSEDMAPCPRCDRGKELEHPLEATGPWGRDGFWRGQPYRIVRAGVLEITA